MNKSTITLSITLLISSGALFAQETQLEKAADNITDIAIPESNGQSMESKLSSWPDASRNAVEAMTSKYGTPDVMHDQVYAWLGKGDWIRMRVTKEESKHSFPVEHTDMLEQCIAYKVPASKMDDLGMFDGSITFDRTQGLMCARCDMEANNFLALNLANDIITNKKTVASARKAYGDIVKQKMQGGKPGYMEKLTFSTQKNTEDADINTTGLTKQDVMKGAMKSAMK